MNQVELVDNSMEMYYSKPVYFSYSAIKLLRWNPLFYKKKYIERIDAEEKIDSYLLEGKLIHCLLLQPQEFDKLFLKASVKIPSNSNKKIIHRVFKHHKELCSVEADVDNPERDNNRNNYKLTDYANVVLDILNDIGLHQSLTDDKPDKEGKIKKTANQKRIEKICTAENIAYFDFLVDSEGRSVIDEDIYEYCSQMVNILKQNEKINILLGLDNISDDIEVFNEIEIKTKFKTKYSFGLKGILDNIVINHTDKVIYLNDFKTTSKEIVNFKESVEFYKYWMQMAIYYLLIKVKFLNLINNGYLVKCSFIVIDHNEQSYIFKVSEDTLRNWIKLLRKELEKVNYHFQNKDFNLPYELAIGDVRL